MVQFVFTQHPPVSWSLNPVALFMQSHFCSSENTNRSRICFSLSFFSSFLIHEVYFLAALLRSAETLKRKQIYWILLAAQRANRLAFFDFSLREKAVGGGRSHFNFSLCISASHFAWSLTWFPTGFREDPRLLFNNVANKNSTSHLNIHVLELRGFWIHVFVINQ